MTATFDNLIAMLKAPFVGDLDLWHLFLLVGVVLIFAMVWAVILHYARTFHLSVD
jgi:hypothetical protein